MGALVAIGTGGPLRRTSAPLVAALAFQAGRENGPGAIKVTVFRETQTVDEAR